MSILFYGKTAKTTTDGKVPIYMRVTIDGHRWEVSTSNYVEPSRWASGMGKVRGNSEDARTINMHLDILKRKAYEYRIKGPEYWYLSPLHEEKDPSFSVNRKLNQWYDFSIGKGGNLVDFGIQYHQCSVSELLQKLSGPHTDIEKHQVYAQQMKDTEKKSIEILSTHLISSYPLTRYLRSRRIIADIANRYCQEVRYKSNDKIYYALGFKNDSGGYELRNEKYKGGNSPKDVTYIHNGAKDLAVFEGFFDFLSYQTLNVNQDGPDRNFLILNSTAFFEKKLPFMQEHRHVHLYLDTDKTGEKCTLQALAIDNDKFKDERGLYHPYKDLNDWLMHFGQAQRQRLQQKP